MSFIPVFYKSADLATKTTFRLTLYRRPNYVCVDKTTSESEEDSTKWNRLKHELFCSVFQGKKGCLITMIRDSYESNVSNWDTVIDKRFQHTSQIYLLPKETWSREELWKLTSSDHFDWEDIFMSPNLDAKKVYNMTKQDVDKFWKFLNTSKFNPKNFIEGIEVMGGFGDGDGIIWHNPSIPKVDAILRNFKNLASKLEVPYEEA